MKSKPLTYFLIAVVLVLWGVIAKKIISPHETPPVASQTPKPSAPRQAQADTLLLNYRDPFGISAKRVVEESYNPVIQPIPEIPPPPKREKINLRCVGRITKNGVPRFLIDQAGTQNIIQKGEELGGFKLTEIFPDSLRFTKDGLTYCIKTES